MILESDPLNILIVAGEVSGDLHGAHLARTLQAQRPNLRLIGAGGVHMRAAGVRIEVETTRFASMGLMEPLPYIWPLHKVLRTIRDLIKSERPHLAILIDHQGFNMTLARFLQKLGVPVIYYFPPQVWIGSSFFAAAVGRVTQLIISAFECEAQLYNEYGGHAVYLGHPLVDIVKPAKDFVPILAKHGIDATQPLVGVMPGSREHEVERLAGPMFDAARIIQSRHPEYRFILPLAAAHLRPLLAEKLEEAGMSRHFHIISEDVYTCLSRCSAVITTSGTSTLEIALLEVPMVVAYRLHPISAWFGLKLAITPYVALPNILLDEMVLPEFIQRKVTPEHLSAATLEILDNPERAASIRHRMREIREKLGEAGAIERVASRVLEEVDARCSPVLAGAAR
jgi:lipid-A-disaccharide synthase